jgi:hypothetical protein
VSAYVPDPGLKTEWSWDRQEMDMARWVALLARPVAVEVPPEIPPAVISPAGWHGHSLPAALILPALSCVMDYQTGRVDFGRRDSILAAMRHVLKIGAFLVVSLALAAGCNKPPPAPRPGVTLRPTVPADSLARTPMFNLRVVILKHRVRPDAPVEDIWRLLGTTNVPYEKRALWEANDLRLGDGAHLAADRLSDLVTETPDRMAFASTLQVLENMDFTVSLGGERDLLDVLWTDASGRLQGRHFTKALAEFRVVCRGDPKDPDAVLIALAPEVLYGPEELRWVRTEAGPIQRMARASCLLTDLAAEVRLGPGRLLVIGCRRTSDLSPGGAMFQERRGPDAWLQTIILTAERAKPGELPSGGKVPFLTPAKSAAPPKGPTPGKAPPAK